MNFITPLLEVAAAHRREKGRPFVTLSYAQSLDGCISAQPGVALALSGRQSLRLTHKLRAGHDAILVGIGTVLSDNPRLNVRLVDGTNPRPIVVDTNLRLPLHCNLLTQASRPLLVATREKPDPSRVRAVEASGAVVLPLPETSDGRVDLAALLDRLAEMGINTLMVEGGARIITSFLLQKLADFIVLTIAPVLVGGLRAVSDLGQGDPTKLLRLEQRGHRWLGEDLILWGHLTTEESEVSVLASAPGA
jgi:3,4-dihydroxy 2-butanone 4-phosphate synthase/GTP cyclohydrolase II